MGKKREKKLAFLSGLCTVIISVTNVFKSHHFLLSVVPGMCLQQGWSLPITRTSSQKLRPGQTALLPASRWEILSSTITTMQLMRYSAVGYIKAYLQETALSKKGTCGLLLITECSVIHRSGRNCLNSRRRETRSTRSGKTRWTIYKLV